MDGAALTRTRIMTEDDLPGPEDGDDYEEYTYFVGCTCEHDSDDHGWGHCDVPGCDCEGGWEE